MIYTTLFGPVQSRRLGVSLGIDLVRHKVCSLNCVYCECGTTTDLTLERGNYADKATIIAELTHYLANNPKPDFVTFGGSGEPTLNTAIGDVLAFIKRNNPDQKCALLTNSTLLDNPDVRKTLLDFDLVLPSLDAISEDVFRAVNRPSSALKNSTIINGLLAFSRDYKGALWLELFVVPGINDTDEELALFKETITAINPTRVQLNSLDRPGACDWIKPASPEKLAYIAHFLKPLPVEIIARNAASLPTTGSISNSTESITTVLSRRPLTLEEVAIHTRQTIRQAKDTLAQLVALGLLETEEVAGRLFYRVKNDKIV